MTGDEALAKLKAIKFRQGTAVRPDTEQDHVDADEILLNLLASLGFPEVVETFRFLRKWYS